MNLLYQGFSGILAHLFNLFAAPSGAHSARIAVVVLLLFHLDVRAVTGYYDSPA